MADWMDMIKEAKTVAIFSHINSDGDANGSAFAVKYMLDDLGKETYVFVPTPINKSYHFLGINEISCTKKLPKYDLAITVDAPNTKRFGQCESEFFKAKKSICIDHHADNENYANINIVEPDISSACELIYKLFKAENINITPRIATCIYLGIATDTGGFMRGFHGAVTPETWFAIADLVKLGADTKLVNESIFITMRKSVFELYRKGLDRVEFYENGKIAMLCITKRILDETGTELTDTHKLTDIINGIEGVEITAIMTQKGYREQSVSVRAHIKNAQRICKYFGGGGHLKASGCRIYEQFYDAKAELLEQCKKELYRND